MRKTLILLLATAALAVCIAPLHAGPGTWLRKARIAGPDIWYGMSDKQLRDAIDELAKQGVNAVDIDFSSESIERQLEMVGRILSYARSAHPKMRFFVYQAPLESVSSNVDKNRDGKVDAGKTSTYSEHPEWAQRGLNGEPALFYGADANAFWVGKNDEDVWLCPNDPEYKLVWKDHLRRLAAAGVDAIYIDVPFLRGWFDEKRDWGFACACSDCEAIYKSQYGADLPAKIDWNDANFRRFVRFRFEQIAGFIAEARAAVRAGNRKARLIIEHWDGITDSLESACDPTMIAASSDARCHEWSHETASRYHRYTWLEDIVRYLTYRAIDGKDPAWILAYTNEGDTDRMRALAAMQFAAGCNFWETEAPDMAGSVDANARTELFGWLASVDRTYYNSKLEVHAEVGLYYSRDSIVFRDYREHMEPWDCAYEFLGLGMILLQQHVPFCAVLPGDIDDGIEVLVLPNVACLSDEEAAAIEAFADAGGIVVATGETGDFDEDGRKRSTNALADISVVRTNEIYGVDYYDAVSPWRTKPKSETKAVKARTMFASKIWSKVGVQPLLALDGEPFLIVLPWRSNREVQLRFFNIAGVDGDGGGGSFEVGVRLPNGYTAGAARYIHFLGDPEALALSVDSGYVTMQVAPSLHGVAAIRLKK